MLERLSTEFKRYFTLPTAVPSGLAYQALFSIGAALNRESLFSRDAVSNAVTKARQGAHKLMTSQIRDTVSEILPGRIYLSNLPKTTPFSDFLQETKAADEPRALVVSCLEAREMAKSEANLLLEPQAAKTKIHYHWIAMQDVTALVDSNDLIFDALRLMQLAAQQQTPILIHCYSGVGRSAMITAVHLAHLYLLGDATVKALLDKDTPLEDLSKNDAIDTEEFSIHSKKFIADLYLRANEYVYSKRNCCEFDSEDRNNRALILLAELHTQIRTGQSPVAHDESYQFLAAFVQSAEYKKVVQHYYNSALFLPLPAQSSETQVDLRKRIEDFINTLLTNQAGWYAQLAEAVHETTGAGSESNPLVQFCHASTAATAEEKQTPAVIERRQLLVDLLKLIDQLAERYPGAIYSQHVSQATADKAAAEAIASLQGLVLPEDPAPEAALAGRRTPSF
jgi:predicted protein tyrosine phosphatase